MQMTFNPTETTENVRLFVEHIREASVKLSSSESALARVNKGECLRLRILLLFKSLTYSRQAYSRPHREHSGTEHRDQGCPLSDLFDLAHAHLSIMHSGYRQKGWRL